MDKARRVFLLFTGGTIAMDPVTLAPMHSASEILDAVPEIFSIASLDYLQILNIDSADMQPSHWVEIANCIYSRYEDFDGFVVVHGTDTMVYSAAALSFLLQSLSRPIIFTGSQIPMCSSLASDARNNLINAVRYSLMDIAEVCIFFGTRLLRGNRARKISGFEIDAFASASDEPLGVAGLKLRLSRNRTRRADRQVLFRPALEERVYIIKVFPGMEPALLGKVADLGARGIVLEAFGAGNIPIQSRSLLPEIERMISLGIPVVVCTQCEKGSAEDLYPAGKCLKETGAILAHDMTPEAALVKLMWVLGQTHDLAQVAMLMPTNLANEFGE